MSDKTWGDVFLAARRRGELIDSAANIAELWQMRQKQRPQKDAEGKPMKRYLITWTERHVAKIVDTGMLQGTPEEIAQSYLDSGCHALWDYPRGTCELRTLEEVVEAQDA